MAYGSPDRLEDVPAYYADIRGGRPISPENLEDLVARYRRLGIEDSNPLNEITEATRAALEAELGLPVFTGMRHWQPRIADAVEQALAGGADEIVGLVLAPHYSSMSIERYRAQLVDAVARSRRDPLRRALGCRARLRRPARRAGRGQRMRTSSSPPIRCRRGSSTTAIRTRTSCSRRRGSSPRTRASRSGRSRSRASRRPASPGSGRTSSTTWTALAAGGVREVLVAPVGFVADHLEIRWDIDVEAQERAAELGLELDRIELPNADPAFIRVLAGLVRRTAAVPSSESREDGADPGRRGLAPLPRPCERGAQPEGAVRPPRADRGAGRAGARRRVARRRAGRGGRPRRPQRLRQVDAAAPDRRDHQADVGPRRGRRPDRLAARARRRLPPRLQRPRERLPQRRHLRAQAGADPRALRRDRRLRRARAGDRPARPHVLVRDVHAARLRDRGASRRRHPAARRGLRRRRRGLPAQVLRQDLRVQAARRHDRLRLPRRDPGGAAVRAGGAAARGQARVRRADARGDRPLPQGARGRGRPRRARRRPARVGHGRGHDRGRAARRQRGPRSGSSSSPASPSRSGSGSRRRTGSRRRSSSSSCATRRACSSPRTCSTPAASAGPTASASCATTSHRLPLSDGRFHLRLGLADATGERVLHWLDDALTFLVYPAGEERGVVRLEGSWAAEKNSVER